MSALHGRVAIVSGGARGIGAAIVRALVANGATVVAVDNGASIDGLGIEPNVLEPLVAELGDAVAPLARSIADPGVAEEAVALAQARFGGLDAIVNNAAILRDAFVFKGNRADYEAVLQTNLVGAYGLIRAAAPVLRDNAKANRGGEPYRWGRIVDIVSSAAIWGNFGQAAYASAKGGLISLTRVAAHDLARAGITANAIAPFGATRVTDSIVPANDAQAAYKEAALTVDPAYVGRFVAYLCSEDAQPITGQLFGVRGREVFLFSQPRPIARITTDPDPTLDAIAADVARTFTPHFSGLETDLEAFSTPPVV
ncbi:MAG: SDR family oxidoreductase [Vulcanimicrobiaceae bacterium]|jgi:NAD(P)-dependent dehydrogenase (short-subunit alcohol dehydrogenase family)